MLAAMIAFADVPAVALVGSIKVPDDVLNHVAASTCTVRFTPLSAMTTGGLNLVSNSACGEPTNVQGLPLKGPPTRTLTLVDSAGAAGNAVDAFPLPFTRRTLGSGFG